MSASDDLRRDRLVRTGKTSVTTSFHDDVVRALDYLAERYGMTRTEVVRSLVVSRLEYSLGWDNRTWSILQDILTPPRTPPESESPASPVEGEE